MAEGSNLAALPGWGHSLLEEVRVGHLGLLDADARPRVLPVTFALHDSAVWSAVDHKLKRRSGEELARVRWLRARPAATLTVDRYDDDWARLAWVELLGTATVIAAAGRGDVLDALAARYPQYRDRRPAVPLLRLAPERALWWRAAGPR